MKCLSMTIQMKATEQLFLLLVCISIVVLILQMNVLSVARQKLKEVIFFGFDYRGVQGDYSFPCGCLFFF